MNKHLACFLALCAGIVLPAAFAPLSFWPLAFVIPGCLWWLISSASPATAARLGACFGLGYFGVGVHWVYYSLHLFGAAVAPLAALITLLFVLVMVLFPTLLCWCYARVRMHDTVSLTGVFLFAALWLLFELFRGWVFGGFPWLLIGYSQISSVFSGYAPVFGVYGVSWVVVVSSGLLVLIVQRTGRHSSLVAALLLVLFSGAAAALSTIEWTSAKDRALSIRLVQGNIPQEMKFSRERLQTSLRTYTQMSASAPAGTQLVIWPETAIPTYFDVVEPALAPFAKMMQDRGTDVLAGGFYRDSDNRAYNSFRQLGGAQARYSKRHLVPFGEFMPARFLLDFLARFIIIPMSDLSVPIEPIEPLLIQGEPLGISICYEDVFGEEMRALLPASTVLINVSNDAWFGDQPAPQQHQEIAQMRAREFGRPLVRVTNTGISSVINYRGVVTESIAHSTQGTLDVKVVPRTGATPYVSLGNLPAFAVATLTLLLLLVARIRRKNLTTVTIDE